MTATRSVYVFGASNVDITGFTKDKLIYKDANIGYMKTAAGGVGRNIAENLKKLVFNIRLVSVFGDDPLSRFLMDDCRAKGLDISKSLFLNNQPASSFIAVMNEENDLAVGISAMQLYDSLSPEWFIENLPEMPEDSYVVLETNFSESILQAIVNQYPHRKFVLDTVSGMKSLRALPILSHLYMLKTNHIEAAIMSELPDNSQSDREALVQYFIDKGVQKVFITLGKEGVIYGDQTGVFHLPAIRANVVNTIGAGDSFVGGLIYADSQNKDLHQAAKYGMAAAAITVQHNEAVSPEMNPEILEKYVTIHKRNR